MSLIKTELKAKVQEAFHRYGRDTIQKWCDQAEKNPPDPILCTQQIVAKIRNMAHDSPANVDPPEAKLLHTLLGRALLELGIKENTLASYVKRDQYSVWEFVRDLTSSIESEVEVKRLDWLTTVQNECFEGTTWSQAVLKAEGMYAV